MKIITLPKGIKKGNFILKKSALAFVLVMLAGLSTNTFAQSVLFDFDNAPNYTSLPIDQTVSGITAHFSATGQGFSIQDANVLGFTPAGFAGRVIYPNSVYQADLLVSFDHTLTDFSIMYSCQELGCDDAALMRVTAYMGSTLVGTNTRTATFPGTWPTDTLSCSFPQGFDNVVVHYDNRPPTCQDYGVIFMADNMVVTASGSSSIANPPNVLSGLVVTNPTTNFLNVAFVLAQSENLSISIYDLNGRLVETIFTGRFTAGSKDFKMELNSELIRSGVYFLNIKGEGFSESCRFVLVE